MHLLRVSLLLNPPPHTPTTFPPHAPPMPGELLVSSAPMEVDSASSSSTTTLTLQKKLAGNVAKNTIDLYLISDEDAHYEQEILRDPYSSLKPWMRYIEYKMKTGSIQEQVFVFERACKTLPRSYKLWKMVCFYSRPGTLFFCNCLADASWPR